MAFDQIAKSLLQKTKSEKPTKEELDSDLEAVGFSRRDVLQEYRTLYDTTEEDSVKRQVLDTMTKIHGLTEDGSAKQLPAIHIHVSGDNSRVAMMLNPNLVHAASGEV